MTGVLVYLWLFQFKSHIFKVLGSNKMRMGTKNTVFNVPWLPNDLKGVLELSEISLFCLNKVYQAKFYFWNGNWVLLGSASTRFWVFPIFLNFLRSEVNKTTCMQCFYFTSIKYLLIYVHDLSFTETASRGVF